MKTAPMMNKKLAKFFENTYNFYNKPSFFPDILPECHIGFSQKVGINGTFLPNQWIDSKQKQVHEILLNPQILYQKPIEMHAIIVRNMVLFWLYLSGDNSRQDYINKKAAKKVGILFLGRCIRSNNNPV